MSKSHEDSHPFGPTQPGAPAKLPPLPPGARRPAENNKARWFGDYYLVDAIGSGGMAEVFRAVRSGPEGFVRTFVIKRIKPAHVGSEDFVRMFCEEARISAMLSHPNVVQVYDFGQIDGAYFLAMEYLRGKDLLSVMRAMRDRRTTLPPSLAAYIGHKVALGLAYVHGVKGRDGRPLNLVHRDINPSNVFLLRAGGVKILDFGIAKSAALTRQETQAGFVKGKLAYLSPEQARCEPLDGRSDVFSLGVTLWEALTSKSLFRQGTDYQTVKNVLELPVPPPSRLVNGIPPELDAVVLRALERDPRRRTASAKELARELGEIARTAHGSDEDVAAMLRDVYGEHSSHVVPIFSDEPRARAATEPAHRHPSGMPTAELQASDAAIGPPEASVIALGAPRATRPSSRQPVVEPLPAAEPVRRPETSRRLGGVVVGVGIVVAVVALSVARWVMPVLAAPQTAATSPAPTSVRVAVESSPSGAEIVDPNGRVIGTTPAVLSLPRAERPWRLLARKPGHDRIAFAARGDGDSFASLTLPTASRAR